MRYHLTWLTDQFDKGESLEFVFFSDDNGRGMILKRDYMLSQWYPSPFSVNEIVYKSAGHWMMGKKALLFGDREIFRRILDADRPEQVKMLGSRIRDVDEFKWVESMHEIVREGNFHKFNQSKKLRTYLLNTGDAILAATNPLDDIWGIGLAQDSKRTSDPYAWRGLNLFGFALMEIRDYLRNADYEVVIRDSKLTEDLRKPASTGILLD